jgi:toxin ParE1/3/4
VAIRLRPAFVDDLTEAFSYLAERSRSAADQLLDRAETLLEMLSDFPLLGRSRDALARGLRSIRIQGFPHLVFYRVDDGDIVAVRLLHGARRLRRSQFAG